MTKEIGDSRDVLRELQCQMIFERNENKFLQEKMGVLQEENKILKEEKEQNLETIKHLNEKLVNLDYRDDFENDDNAILEIKKYLAAENENSNDSARISKKNVKSLPKEIQAVIDNNVISTQSRANKKSKLSVKDSNKLIDKTHCSKSLQALKASSTPSVETGNVKVENYLEDLPIVCKSLPTSNVLPTLLDETKDDAMEMRHLKDLPPVRKSSLVQLDECSSMGSDIVVSEEMISLDEQMKKLPKSDEKSKKRKKILKETYSDHNNQKVFELDS